MPKRKRFFFFQLRTSLRLSTLRNSILVCVLNIIPHTIFFISITIIMIELHCYLAHCFVCLVHDLHLKKCKQLSGTADKLTNILQRHWHWKPVDFTWKSFTLTNFRNVNIILQLSKFKMMCIQKIYCSFLPAKREYREKLNGYFLSFTFVEWLPGTFLRSRFPFQKLDCFVWAQTHSSLYQIEKLLTRFPDCFE